MKKIVCLFSCLFGVNLSAMGDDFQLKLPTLYIICIARVNSTDSLDSLQDCKVESPKRKTPPVKRNGICPVVSPKPKGYCPVPTPSPRKK